MNEHAAARWLGLFIELGQLSVIGLFLELLLFEGTEVIWLIRLGVIAALLAGILKSQGWFVLLALQASLFLREPRRSEMYFGVMPVLFCVTVLAIIAYSYLGRSFRMRLSDWLVGQLRTAFSGIENLKRKAEQESAESHWMWFSGTRLLVWFVLVSVLMIVLRRLPLTVSMRSEWLRSSIENDLTVWPGASLLVVAILLIVVFREMAWRQMSAAQASLYMKSTFMLYHYRDLRMIVLRRLKLKRAAVGTSVDSKLLVERSIEAGARK